MHDIREVVEARRAVTLPSGQRHAQIGAAVISVEASDDVLLLWPAATRVIVVGEPDSRVVGIRACAGVADVIQISRRQSGELSGQLCGWRVRGIDERREEGQ